MRNYINADAKKKRVKIYSMLAYVRVIVQNHSRCYSGIAVQETVSFAGFVMSVRTAEMWFWESVLFFVNYRLMPLLGVPQCTDLQPADRKYHEWSWGFYLPLWQTKVEKNGANANHCLVDVSDCCHFYLIWKFLINLRECKPLQASQQNLSSL